MIQKQKLQFYYQFDSLKPKNDETKPFCRTSATSWTSMKQNSLQGIFKITGKITTKLIVRKVLFDKTNPFCCKSMG